MKQSSAHITIRTGVPNDAPELVKMIRHTMRTSYATDYTEEELKQSIAGITLASVLRAIEERVYFVAEDNGQLVGTISYTPGCLRTLMIAPNAQGRGIGTRLAQTVEEHARSEGRGALSVSSSLTAEGFYEKRGYRLIRVEYHGTERCPIYELTL